MSEELYKKYRPRKLSQVVGQEEAVKTLKGMMKEGRVAHTLLFAGPSGCGKTTLARILAKKLGCGDGDYQEINAADYRGIDMARGITKRLSLAPLHGSCRVFYIDECHQVSKDAWNALLKPLEDTPAHVYFLLATTDPQKLIATVKTRATVVTVKPLSLSVLTTLVQSVLSQEERTVSEEVCEKLVEASEGSARKALVLLNQILGIPDEEAQLDAIRRSNAEHQAIELARLLMGKPQWIAVAKVLKEVDEDPEKLRHMMLAYFRKILLAGGKGSNRAYDVIMAFSGHFYDSKEAGFAAACYELCSPRK